MVMLYFELIELIGVALATVAVLHAITAYQDVRREAMFARNRELIADINDILDRMTV